MALTEAPMPSKAPTPAQELRQKSGVRWQEAFDDAKRYNLIDRVMEARCLLELGSLENDTLKKLRLLARAQLAYEELSTVMEGLKKQIDNTAIDIGARTIPSLMDSVDIDHFGLTSGTVVRLEQKVHASLKKENAEAGCDWLEKQGFGALVKRTLTVPFSTKQGKLADKVAKAVEKALGAEYSSVKVTDARTVHHSTLAAWVRERLSEGEEVPAELFSVYNQRVAKIVEK